MGKETLQELSGRLLGARIRLLSQFGFFGCLLMNMRLGIQKCGTAYTDMKRVVFDPEFLTRLSDAELDFVLLHEVLHCALLHCTRSQGFNRKLFNIACDIVVNSHILSVLGIDDFQVDKEPVMHLAPDGGEGCAYTVEEIYEMLEAMESEQKLDLSDNSTLDNHDEWTKINDPALEDKWHQYVSNAVAGCEKYGGNIPGSLKRVVDEMLEPPKRDWKKWLQEFIQFDHYDYSFQPPDRRYCDADFFLPGFSEEGDRLEQIWICVDISGSISREELSMALGEIRQLLIQMDSLSGKISFFDWDISEPQDFASEDDLNKIKMKGGGGTSFHCIFKRLAQWEGEMPKLILILTDGFAEFPEEKEALGIPVFWLIKGEYRTPNWGEVARF